MNTTAFILALSWLTPPVGKLWKARIGENSILARVVWNCKDSGVIDNICILTDDTDLASSQRPEPAVRTYVCPENYHGHPFNPLNIELQSLYRAFDLTLEADIHADLTFFVPWNMPFLHGRLLESMYHTLLDDPLTACILPISPVDPQLFGKVMGADGFFPIWGQKGLDRQLIQQLYRPTYACLFHWNRVLKTIPKISGLFVDNIQAFTVNNEDELECAVSLQSYLLKEDDSFA
jgi:hypothetical protein